MTGLVKSSFIIALQSIARNKFRAFLTMLGVIIGVGSVVLLTSIGTGLQAYVTDQFASLGSNILFVVPGKPFGEGGGFGNQEQAVIESTKPTLKQRYMTDILRNHRDVIRNGAVTAASSASIHYGDKNKKIVLYAVTASYPDVRNSPLDKGVWFTQVDDQKSARVLVLGPDIAKELFGAIDPVGKRVKVNDSQTYTVVGVLAKQGGGFGGPSFDQYVYLPLSTLFDNFNTQLIDSFILDAKDQNSVEPAKKAIEQELLRYLKEDDFTVFDQTQLLSTINSILGVLTAGLGGIAAISLVVGGIGIMNIMLVTVTERTREIGLRKALGATPGRIMLQFLIEAALLSVMGGLVGLLIAYLGSLAIQAYFPAKVTPQAVILAFSVSTLVGLIFGAAPARRAANLSPIEALRYE